MGILAFLALLCCLILLIWGLRVFSPSAPKQKPRSKNQAPQQLAPKFLESHERDTTTPKPTLPGSQVQSRWISPRQPLVSKKRRTRSTRNKHRLNIQHGDRVLQ